MTTDRPFESKWLLRDLNSSSKNLRMFENPLLERLTYVHPIVPLLIWVPVAAFLFAERLVASEPLSLVTVSICFLSGLAFWSLLEYFIHRFAFHFTPKNALQKRFLFLVHGVHHDDPNDARRLLIMPAVSISLSIPFYAAFWLVCGSVYVNPVFSGFLVGYLLYDYIHFATHFVRPRWEWLRVLKHHHLSHHFTSQHARFGVSNRFWDRVFATLD